MHRTRVLAVMAGLALLAPSAVAAADETDPQHPDDVIAAAETTGKLDTTLTDIDQVTGSVTVMIELTEDPVAVVEANTDGELSESAEQEIVVDLKQSQDEVATHVAAAGGEILSNMQSAYNGMRVSVASEALTELARLPQVKAIHDVPVHEPANHVSVPYLGVPAVWQNSGYTGSGVKVAVIDTGVDYTHATFGGEGTPEAYDAAVALADPTDVLGPRVKGGYDFAGDAYTPGATPVPDANPIDCDRAGHGTHVAATAAGSGVLSSGDTFQGPYDETTHTNTFRVGPGVAPQADIYALKVFGCTGGTDLVTEALDWAVANDMDVVNLSLGSAFGKATDPDAVAATNAAAAGIVVVAAAGNDGTSPYLTSSPASGAGVISVAANDGFQTYPSARLTVDGVSVEAINANDAALPASAPIRVLRTADGAVSTGCDYDEYAAIPRGAIAVTTRGGCARVLRAINAQRWGLAGVIMLNDTDTYPPYEGTITENPETKEQWRVRVPFLGVKSSDADTVVGWDQQTTTLASGTIDNPSFSTYADFSSAGPRSGDSGLRPSVTAPGVSTLSAAVGKSTRGEVKSGTSMATPHVAGVAVLGVQAHPTWTAEEISAAIVGTADFDAIGDYRPSRGGGLVDPTGVVGTPVLAYGDATTVGDKQVRDSVLSFGYAEFTSTYEATRTITLENKSDRDITYQATTTPAEASHQATVRLDQTSVTVPAGGSAEVKVSISVEPSALGSSIMGGSSPWFKEVSGNVSFTSETAGKLNIPYLLVPRGISNITAPQTTADGVTNVTFSNADGGLNAYASLYTWGLTDPQDVEDPVDDGHDIANVGVASYEALDVKTVHFAINSSSRFSNPAGLVFNVNVDNNLDGTADYRVISMDSGLVRTKEIDGKAEVFVADLKTGAVYAGGSMTLAPTDASTVVLAVPTDMIGVTGKFSYQVSASSLVNASSVDEVDSWASYDISNKAFNDGQFFRVNVNDAREVQLTRNEAAFADQQPLGYMAVVFDNAQGATEAITGTVTDPAPTPSPTESPAPSESPTATASPTATGSPVPSGSPAPSGAPQPVKPTPVPVKPGLPDTGSAR